MDRILLRGRRTPENQKALPLGRKSLGSAHASRGRASTLPANILAVGPKHSKGNNGSRYKHDIRITIFMSKNNQLYRTIRTATYWGIADEPNAGQIVKPDPNIKVNFSGQGAEEPDHWHRWLLRPRRERPSRRAPEPRDELPPSHP
jgi:hypothetical protein